MTHALVPAPHHERRPLLGLRHQPGRLALAFMRMPLRAYAHGQGHLLGHTFLEFTHVGRTSGTPYHAVAMVLDYDEVTGEAVICAAWGAGTDWCRNLLANPAVNVTIGDTSFSPVQRLLTDDEAFRVACRFRATHPHRLHLLSRVLGWGDLDDDAHLCDFVESHPFIAFRRRADA